VSRCPRTSIYEASERDFRVVLARDAISGLYERGERELKDIGVHIMSADEVTATLGAATTGPSDPCLATGWILPDEPRQRERRRGPRAARRRDPSRHQAPSSA
jgi:hypothetical protein